MKKAFYLVLFMFFASQIKGKEVKHVKEGNLALPTSQQPSPLFCFGQNILDKGDILALGCFNTREGRRQNYTKFIPFIFYGISDDLSIIAGIPAILRCKLKTSRSSGIGDLLVQFEYAFINKDYLYHQNQATIVLNMTLPTGSSRKFPPIGVWCSNFFCGLYCEPYEC
jgi:hypothetical protein